MSAREIPQEEIDNLYDFSKRVILTNEMLTRWLRSVEERLRKLESRSRRSGRE